MDGKIFVVCDEDQPVYACTLWVRVLEFLNGYQYASTCGIYLCTLNTMSVISELDNPKRQAPGG